MDNNSFTNIFFGNVSNVQIQQGTASSSQNQECVDLVDYEKYKNLLDEIKQYDNQYDEVFEDKASLLRDEIKKLENMINNKESESKIKSVLGVIKDLAIGVSGGLIANGIAGLIDRF